MKLLKFGLRFWITVTSIFSFLAGWVMLAHAPKPGAAGSSSAGVTAPMPTLEPLHPLSDFAPGDNNVQNQPTFGFQPRNQNRQSRPFFSTGGS